MLGDWEADKVADGVCVLLGETEPVSEGLCDGVPVQDGLWVGLGVADRVSEGVSVGVGDELGVKLCVAVPLWLRDCVPLRLTVLLGVVDGEGVAVKL